MLTRQELLAGHRTDPSGSDTRVYFNGDYECEADEVRVVQRSTLTAALTNQGFNIFVS